MNKEIGELPGGGSVAHTMVNAAIVMGCNPIIFIGQDFAYTNEKKHADIAKDRWENCKSENTTRQNDIFVKDIYGKKIRTSIVLNNYRKEMENIISRHKEITFINATEGGAAMEGTVVQKFADVINEQNLIGHKEEKRLEINGTDEIIKSRVKGKLGRAVKSVEKTIDLYRNAIKVLEDCKRDINIPKKLENTHMIKLDRIENEIYKINDDLEFFSTILYPIIYKNNTNTDYIITNTDSKKEAYSKVINGKRELYSDICKVLSDNLGMIKECYAKL